MRSLSLCLLLALAGCTAEEPLPSSATDPSGSRAEPTLRFVEGAAAAGLDFEHDSGHDGRNLFPEIIAGGVALFDMDGDGDLDAYFVQSGSVAAPGGDRARNRLYANDGEGRFSDVTAGSGADDPGYGMGVAAGDYDGDGDTDLYVTNLGDDVLLRNDGEGKFVDVTAAAGIDNPSWGTSAAFLDYDRDGDLDIFVTNYVNWSLRNEQDCFNGAGVLDYCLPTNYSAPAMDRLFANEGGRFRDVTREVGLQLAFGNGLGVVANDFNDDGWLDIFVANDTMMNQLWVSDGEGAFVDEALLRGSALDEHGQTKAGMGVASEDVDDDGDTDLIVVNLEGQTDSFFRNEEGVFLDHTGAIGLASTSRLFTRFGIGLIDLDNDGDLDLFQANGRVTRTPENVGADPFAEENVVHEMRDGRFVAVSPQAGLDQPLAATSRGAAFGDVDGDGRVDVLVVNKDGPAHLLLNRTENAGNWARLDIREANGTPALGARATLSIGDRTRTRFMRAAYSYCASSDPRIHVGLGEAERIDAIVVRYSDGEEERFDAVEAGATTVLRRGAGAG